MTSTCDENMLNFQIEEHKKISDKYNSQVIEIKSLKALVCYPKNFSVSLKVVLRAWEIDTSIHPPGKVSVFPWSFFELWNSKTPVAAISSFCLCVSKDIWRYNSEELDWLVVQHFNNRLDTSILSINIAFGLFHFMYQYVISFAVSL